MTASPPRPRVVLIGNYIPDQQQSMLRFADCVAAGMTARGVPVTRLTPTAWLGRLPLGRLRKWLGYVDKFVLFVPRLWWAARRHDLVHIGDHSNAMYAQVTPRTRTLVTCHDLLAVRGALGEETYCPASFTGRLLQRWIVAGLTRAGRLAAVSGYTRDDLHRLLPQQPAVTLVYNGLNHPYRVLTLAERETRRAALPSALGPQPFVLHVGSNQARKNRAAVVRTVAGAVAAGWDGRLVLAGQAPDAPLLKLIASLGLGTRVVTLANVDNELLELLYNDAHALLFPSRFEGFGWPLIEAQACGCPVIASDIPPFVEISGGAARLHPTDDATAMTASVLALADAATRQALITAGLENAQRFTMAAMIDGYLDCYTALLEHR